MFESLTQIDRMSTSISHLEKQKQLLKQMLRKSKFTDKKIQKQVSNTIDDKIHQAKKKYELCQNLQKQILNEQFINAQFFVEDLVSDVKKLPQWFSFVFQKQFEKQRNNFDSLAKRLYKQYCLFEKKNELFNEIKSFQTLHKRYLSLNKTQQQYININSEAQTFQNRCTLLIQRFVNFVELVGSKIMHFVQENVQKSLNYSHQISHYTDNSTNLERLRQHNNNPPKPMYEMAKDRLAFITLDENHSKYLSTMPAYIDTHGTHLGRGKSQGSCMNHRVSSGLSVRERPMHMVGFNQSKYDEGSRFNYRDYMPKWMNRKLASFYT